MPMFLQTHWGRRLDYARALAGLARREIAPLALLLTSAVCLWVFAGLLDDVGENETHAFDMAMLEALRAGAPDDPLGPEWLVEAARDFTSLGGTYVLVMFALVAGVYLILTRRTAEGVYLGLCLAGGSLLSNGVKALIGRSRPEEIYQAMPVFTASFPSGHALLSAVFYLTLGALLARVQERRRTKAFILLTALWMTVLVGLTRIYLGVHWTTDVVAGWTLGAAWAALCWLGLLMLQRRAGARPPR